MTSTAVSQSTSFGFPVLEESERITLRNSFFSRYASASLGTISNMRASSKAIYEAYTRWCDDNAQKPMSANRVSSELAQNELLYNVEATNNVHIGGKRVRGFVGIEVVDPLPC